MTDQHTASVALAVERLSRVAINEALRADVYAGDPIDQTILMHADIRRVLEALRTPASGEVEAARKIGRWIDSGMPDHSDDTPTREALKRDLRTVLAAALLSPARREGED